MAKHSLRHPAVPVPPAFPLVPLTTMALAGAAILLVSWGTAQYGVGVSPDSAHYIGAARSLSAGHGLRFNGEPFTHWPPLYPLLLASAGLIRLDAFYAARVADCVLFALNTVLVCRLAYRLSGRSASAGICAGTAFLLMPEMLHIHTMAWSEPPFLCLTFLALLLFDRWLRCAEYRLLCAAGLLIGLSLFTRFVGVTLLPPFVLCIGVFRAAPTCPRVREALILCGIATTPLALWLPWSISAGHGAADRPVVYHPPPASALALLALPTLFALALAYLLACKCTPREPLGRQRRGAFSDLRVRESFGRLLGQWVRDDNGDGNALRLWILVFLFTYSVFIFLSICYLDALTPLDGRILSPLYVFGILLTVPLLWTVASVAAPRGHNGIDAASHIDRRVVAWKCLAGCVVIAVSARGGAGFKVLTECHDRGYGYTSRAWRASAALVWTNALPIDARLYSNSPELIAFHSNRTVQPLPAKLSPTSLLPNADLDRDVTALIGNLRRGALVLYFTRSPRSYLLSAADLEQRYHIPVLLRLPDGIVYGYSAAAFHKGRVSLRFRPFAGRGGFP